MEVTVPSFKDFLSRIQTDHAFYLQFRLDPQGALAAYDLSSEEQAVLAKSGIQLWNRVGGTILDESTLGIAFQMTDVASSDPAVGWRLLPSQTTQALPRIDESEFNAQTVLERPEIQQIIAKIRDASGHSERLTALSTLMEEIG
jgi:hypothetical protein